MHRPKTQIASSRTSTGKRPSKPIPTVLYVFIGCIAFLNMTILMLPSYLASYDSTTGAGYALHSFANDGNHMPSSSKNNVAHNGVDHIVGNPVLIHPQHERREADNARAAARDDHQDHIESLGDEGHGNGNQWNHLTIDAVHSTKQQVDSHHVSNGQANSQPDQKDITDPIQPYTRQAKPADAGTSTNSSSTQKPKYHIIFSTGCSIFQDWQSYVFFYHILQSGQEGQVTRIVSGCKDKDIHDMEEVFAKDYAVMAPDRFNLHLTPDFSRVQPGRPFKYYNKPYGVRHWMQNVFGYPQNHAEHDDTIVILLDPDQILLRPFTNDFNGVNEVWKHRKDTTPRSLKVEHGSPFAQQYGFNLQWKDKIDMSKILEPDGDNRTSNVDLISRSEAFDYYFAMGPPYIATAKDMYSIVSTWCKFAPRVHEQYPYLLAEMFAYNLAAAHLGLRHTIASSFMVSDVFTGPEGWDLVKSVPPERQCENYPFENLPHVIHYCQKYIIGKWFINKYRLRKDFISCEAPLLKEPPADVALKYNYGISPGGGRKDYKNKQASQMTFVVCGLIRALNQAAYYYKQHHCDPKTANFEYSYVFFANMTDEVD